MLFDNVKKLSEKQGISISVLEERVGLGKNTLYKWKNQSPKVETLQKVADYFNVSVDYLLGREEKPTDSDLEDALDNAKQYSGRALNEADRATIKALLKGYFDNKE